MTRRSATNGPWRATSAESGGGSASEFGRGVTLPPIVRSIRDAIVDATGGSLVGLYVFGSLATGGFEPRVSDIDLIAVLTETPDEPLVGRLETMHERFTRANPEWDDRVEVDYVSREGLAHCRTRSTTIARISPGEPLHLLDAGRDFVLDWYPARRAGIGLIGPSIDRVIPEIPEAEYLDELRWYLAGLLDRSDEDLSPGTRSYAILTMCRGMYTLRSSEHVSKQEAATRARRELPRWAHVIDRAVARRDGPRNDVDVDDRATALEADAFLAEMARFLELPTGRRDAPDHLE
jgi:Domain of unknown function (DUF4111)/Nucleotidyltransferase domain